MKDTRRKWSGKKNEWRIKDEWRKIMKEENDERPKKWRKQNNGRRIKDEWRKMMKKNNR